MFDLAELGAAACYDMMNKYKQALELTRRDRESLFRVGRAAYMHNRNGDPESAIAVWEGRKDPSFVPLGRDKIRQKGGELMYMYFYLCLNCQNITVRSELRYDLGCPVCSRVGTLTYQGKIALETR